MFAVMQSLTNRQTFYAEDLPILVLCCSVFSEVFAADIQRGVEHAGLSEQRTQ